jgi:DNA-binding IclR family transcriptional regulator
MTHTDFSSQCSTVTARVARLTWLLAQGARPTTAEVAQIANLCNSGAYRLLDRMSTEIPLVQEDGRWSILPDK